MQITNLFNIDDLQDRKTCSFEYCVIKMYLSL